MSFRTKRLSRCTLLRPGSESKAPQDISQLGLVSRVFPKDFSSVAKLLGEKTRIPSCARRISWWPMEQSSAVCIPVSQVGMFETASCLLESFWKRNGSLSCRIAQFFAKEEWCTDVLSQNLPKRVCDCWFGSMQNVSIYILWTLDSKCLTHSAARFVGTSHIFSQLSLSLDSSSWAVSIAKSLVMVPPDMARNQSVLCWWIPASSRFECKMAARLSSSTFSTTLFSLMSSIQKGSDWFFGGSGVGTIYLNKR